MPTLSPGKRQDQPARLREPRPALDYWALPASADPRFHRKAAVCPTSPPSSSTARGCPPAARATREIRNPATLDLARGWCRTAETRTSPRRWRRPRGPSPPGGGCRASRRPSYLRGVATKIRAQERELSTLMARETGKPLIEAVDCIEWVAACFDYYAEVGRRSYGTSIPPVARAPAQLHDQGAVRRRRGHRAVQLPAAADGVEGRAGAGGGEHGRVQAAASEPAVQPAAWPGATTGCRPEWSMSSPAAPDTGEALVRHPRVDLIAFTGSVAAGRRIAAQAGQELKKVNLELGSVDPFIVFEDADLDVAVPGVAWARLLNAGQVCTSPKRIYVVEPIAERVHPAARGLRRTLRVGDPMDPGVDVGPLISAEALEHGGSADRARGRGRRQAAPGRLPRPSRSGLRGHFLEPTDPHRTCATARCRRPRRSSVRCSRSPSRATRTRRSAWPTTAATGSARRSTPGTSRRPCGRCRRSRPARSGSTIRSPTTTRGRSAGCGGAGSGASWARKASTPSASRSTCTWTT